MDSDKVKPGALVLDSRELANMIRPALAALPTSAVSQFIERLAEAAIAHERGDEEALDQLFLGVVADYRLSFNANYRQATKEVDRADELNPPREIDRDTLFTDLRAKATDEQYQHVK